MKMDTKSIETGAVWLGASAGVGVPAFSFFSSYTPPLFPGVSVISAALSSAILLIALAWNPGAKRKGKIGPAVVKRGGRLVSLSLIVLIVYVLLLHFTTIENNIRFQIGFGRLDLTLTEYGRALRDRNPSWPAVTMLQSEGLAQERVPIIWETWSIYLAGFLLIVLYLCLFILWTGGFALLEKYRLTHQAQQKAARA